MSDELRTVSDQLTRHLELEMPPVQISYLDHPPAGIPEHPGGVPSVCTFFALGTRSPFYASLPNHEDCEIGAFVLGIPPEGAVGGRLMATIGDMQKEGYLNPGEEAQVPHNSVAPKYVAYGPLGSLPVAPTGVLVFTNPRGAMLAAEAAGAAPETWAVPMNGRPMCAIMPILNQGAPVALSLGCVGSRIYIDMGVDKMVVGIRGDRLAAFVGKLERIVRANEFVKAEDAARKAKSATSFHADPAPRFG
ncbi:MAG: DUF169 domain-containing protein [Candidatus Lutacidiplasmatales archaeon]